MNVRNTILIVLFVSVIATAVFAVPRGGSGSGNGEYIIGSLEVTGGVKFGNTGTPFAGMIRWTGIDFQGYNGSTWESLTGASATADVGWAHGSGVVYTANSSDQVAIGTNMAQAMLHVGTGQSSVGATAFTSTEKGLMIMPNTNRARIMLEGNAASDIILRDDGAGADAKTIMLVSNNGFTKFRSMVDSLTAPKCEDLLTMDNSTGNVGLGTTSPQATLHVFNNKAGEKDMIRLGSGSSGDQMMYFPNGSSSLVWELNYLYGDAGTLDLRYTDLPIASFTATGLTINNGGNPGIGLIVQGDNDPNMINTSASNDRVGIGTATPEAKLDVVGKIKIGTDSTTASTGMIRWTGSDFEGYNGSSWKSFTSGSAASLDAICKNGYATTTSLEVGGKIKIGTDSSTRQGGDDPLDRV